MNMVNSEEVARINNINKRKKYKTPIYIVIAIVHVLLSIVVFKAEWVLFLFVLGWLYSVIFTIKWLFQNDN